MLEHKGFGPATAPANVDETTRRLLEAGVLFIATGEDRYRPGQSMNDLRVQAWISSHVGGAVYFHVAGPNGYHMRIVCHRVRGRAALGLPPMMIVLDQPQTDLVIELAKANALA